MGGIIHHRDKILPRRSIPRMIFCVRIWTCYIYIFKEQKNSCSTSLLIGIICWPILASPGIRKMPLDFITFGDGELCFLITVCWYFLGLRVRIIRITFVLYQSSVYFIVICISWATVVMWLHWSSQGWMERLRRPINNSALSVNTNPPLQWFHWFFFQRAKFNYIIATSYLHYHDIYYLVFHSAFFIAFFLVLE